MAEQLSTNMPRGMFPAGDRPFTSRVKSFRLFTASLGWFRLGTRGILFHPAAGGPARRRKEITAGWRREGFRRRGADWPFPWSAAAGGRPGAKASPDGARHGRAAAPARGPTTGPVGLKMPPYWRIKAFPKPCPSFFTGLFAAWGSSKMP